MKNVRMQFDLPEDRLDELDSLMKKCGISTKKELFNYALTMLEWAVDESKVVTKSQLSIETVSNFMLYECLFLSE